MSVLDLFDGAIAEKMFFKAAELAKGSLGKVTDEYVEKAFRAALKAADEAETYDLAVKYSEEAHKIAEGSLKVSANDWANHRLALDDKFHQRHKKG